MVDWGEGGCIDGYLEFIRKNNLWEEDNFNFDKNKCGIC